MVWARLTYADLMRHKACKGFGIVIGLRSAYRAPSDDSRLLKGLLNHSCSSFNSSSEHPMLHLQRFTVVYATSQDVVFKTPVLRRPL